MTQVAQWPAPFPMGGLIDILKGLTGLQVAQTHLPRKQLGQTGGMMAWILASSATSRELGVDEYRVQQNPNDPSGLTLQPNVCGQRLYTVSLRAESLDRGPSPVSVLERVRWGLRTLNAFAQMDPLGIAVADFEAIQHLGQQLSDDRELVVAIMDVHFNWAVNFSPLSDDGTTIGLVNGDPQIPGTPPTILGTVTPDAPPPVLQFDSGLGGAPLGDGATVGGD